MCATDSSAPGPSGPALDDDGYCYVCGPHNPEGLRLAAFERLPDGGLATRLAFAARHAGPDGRVRRGFVALVLDELGVNALLYAGVPAVSTELRLGPMAPLRPGEEIVVEARSGRAKGRLTEVAVEARRTAGAEGAGAGADRIVARGTIVCMRLEGRSTKALDARLGELSGGRDGEGGPPASP